MCDDWKGGLTVMLLILLTLLGVIKTFAMGLITALVTYGGLSTIEKIAKRLTKKKVQS